MAVTATFAVSGFFLHDLLLLPVQVGVGAKRFFPVVTLAFVVLAALVLVTDALSVDLRRLSVAARSGVHTACLVLAFTFALCVARLSL